MHFNDCFENSEKLENHLYCAGTVYDSFDALLEVLGKLELEQPLYLVYLAQKLFAQEVINASQKKKFAPKYPYSPIELKKNNLHNTINWKRMQEKPKFMLNKGFLFFSLKTIKSVDINKNLL